MNKSYHFTVCIMVSLFVVATVVVSSAAEKKTSWKIAGQMEEACKCNAPCPCWFNSLPTGMNCGGTQVLFLDKARYGKLSLDGLALAHFGQSPDGQTMMNSYRNWTFSYLYIDERATPEQRKALEEIGKTVLPFASSKNIQIRYVPITRTVVGKEHTITVGQHATLSGHLIEGGLGGNPKIVNPPGADPIHHEYLQGRTTKFTYTDAGQNWTLENSNYMFTKFSTNSAEYEKYTAGLAQRMEKMEMQK